jgi:hypothetical protein
MKTPVLLALVIVAGPTYASEHDFALWTGRAGEFPRSMVFRGAQRQRNVETSMQGNFVTAWQALAVIDGGRLLALSASKIRNVGTVEWGGNDAFAVSPKGTLAAIYDDRASRLSITRVKTGAVTRTIGIDSLRRMGVAVMQAPVPIPAVVFHPYQPVVYAAFPSRGSVDGGGMRPSVVVRIPLGTGRSTVVGQGIPVGFVGEDLVRQDGRRVWIGKRQFKVPGGSMLSASGKHLYVVRNTDRGVMLDVYAGDLRSRTKRYTALGIGKATVMGITAMDSIAQAQSPFGNAYSRTECKPEPGFTPHRPGTGP